MALDLHRLGEERSIAMHRAIAEKLESDPSILRAARARVKSWLDTDSVHPSYARAWDSILSEPTERIAATLVDEGEPARALRQVSPFAGALSARERWRIRREVAARMG
ncbi:MAG TPA: hypothetical protein VHU80_07580 [Polyangiaceae bacterium]|jgi:hypothetical protein|nr:hypothetical protein [Polyangiaceae bacterium]